MGYNGRWGGVGGGSNALNLSFSELGSVDFWDSSVVLTAIVCRAFGGSSERKSRAERAFGENGLNRVVTSVMNFVIILGGVRALCRKGEYFGFGFRKVPRSEAASRWLRRRGRTGSIRRL